MAYNFFTIAASGGSNANSGSSATVVYTSSTAVWDGTSVLTVTGAGAVSVNDWINVNSAYIAQVTAASPTSITLSTTAKYGTAPGAGTYTINDGGFFASQVAITAIFGTATVYNSTCFQWQVGNAAFTLAANLTIGVVGSATAPVWHRGYNTTPGDLDSGSTSLTYPTLTCGTFTVTFSGADTLWSGFSFTSTRSGAGITTGTGANQTFRHCRFANTTANTGSFAVGAATNATSFLYCYFTATSTATSIVSSSGAQAFIGCYFVGAGGTTSSNLASSSYLYAVGCTFTGSGLYGISSTGVSPPFIWGNTFYKCGNDAIRLAGALNTSNGPPTIGNNVFVQSGNGGTGYDINNSTGTNTDIVQLINNESYSPATGHLNGFGDWAEYNPLTDGSSPVVSTSNFTLLASATGAGAGVPGQWENIAQQAHPDVGAWQRAAIASGGGIIGG